MSNIYTNKIKTPTVGLEPTTLPLTAGCSTIEPCRNQLQKQLLFKMFSNSTILFKKNQAKIIKQLDD